MIEHRYKSCPECGSLDIEKITDLIDGDDIPENAYKCTADDMCGCEFL